MNTVETVLRALCNNVNFIGRPILQPLDENVGFKYE